MDMVFDFDQRQGLANVGVHGLDGTESVTSIKDALRFLKIRNPAVNFANAVKHGAYNDEPDAEYKRMLDTITFTGGGAREFNVSEGPCSIQADIISAKGNGKYTLSGELPESTIVEFEEREVPLAELPASKGPGGFDIAMMAVDTLTLGAVVVVSILLLKKNRQGN